MNKYITEYKAAELAFNAAGRKIGTREHKALQNAKTAMIENVSQSKRHEAFNSSDVDGAYSLFGGCA